MRRRNKGRWKGKKVRRKDKSNERRQEGRKEGRKEEKNYLVAGDKFGFLHWFDQADGKVVARLDVGNDDEDEGIYHSPVVDEDTLYTQTRDGKLVAIKTP